MIALLNLCFNNKKEEVLIQLYWSIAAVYFSANMYFYSEYLAIALAVFAHARGEHVGW